MIDHLKSVCKYNGIKFYQSEGQYYIEGDSGIVARCLRATRATRIKVDNLVYDLEEVCKYLEKKFDIRFAFEELE